MRGLDPDEKKTLEALIGFAGGSCNESCKEDRGGYTMTWEVVNRLLERGLVVSSPCSTDNRLTHISITGTGKYVLDLVLAELNGGGGGDGRS
jgi:hypothetical protein